RPERERLAASIGVRGPGIVKTAIDRLAPGERTVGAKILATRLVQRCAGSVASGDWARLTDWVDTTCDRYAGVLPAQSVIAAALDGVSRAFTLSADELTDRAFRCARADVEALLAKQRTVASAGTREAVDEIDVVLDGMLLKLDHADTLTAEHSRAVASWCTRLAKTLGDAKDDVLHLTRAGLIHDIGKVTTPASILMAPRRLSEDEFAVMRTHSEEGERIVLEVPLIANLAPAVRSHHERFDGTGYPDNLRGDDIPRVARIVAVADAFNAMIGRRPYRPPLAPSVALERLVEGRGGQFDPEIVDAMIEVVTARA
ncbi:MAG TPA: HD-GYP domain-containing protein, partial [Candidatus Elarobacter sp.]|nr:HD-GYP domain-containing protein [Candidatus Elarobacter sp.]